MIPTHLFKVCPPLGIRDMGRAGWETHNQGMDFKQFGEELWCVNSIRDIMPYESEVIFDSLTQLRKINQSTFEYILLITTYKSLIVKFVRQSPNRSIWVTISVFDEIDIKNNFWFNFQPNIMKTWPKGSLFGIKDHLNIDIRLQNIDDLINFSFSNNAIAKFTSKADSNNMFWVFPIGFNEFIRGSIIQELKTPTDELILTTFHNKSYLTRIRLGSVVTAYTIEIDHLTHLSLLRNNFDLLDDLMKLVNDYTHIRIQSKGIS
jgi:hypothetical protein